MTKLADIFDNASLYKLFQFAVIPKKSLKFIKESIISPMGAREVLDFGCGIGYHAEYFENAEYLGIEPLEKCVIKANERFAKTGICFKVGDHTTLKEIGDETFDLVIAIGVLHHIEDEILDVFISEAKRLLKFGGRLTTFDPVFHPEQSFASKWVVSQDQGRNVRDIEGYLAHAKKHFDNDYNFSIQTTSLRTPYDHIVINYLNI